MLFKWTDINKIENNNDYENTKQTCSLQNAESS